MAACTTAVLTLCETGDHIVAGDTLYGGTHQLFSHTLPRLGIHVTEVKTTDPANVAAAITDKTKLIYLESPANPTLLLTDIGAVSDIAAPTASPCWWTTPSPRRSCSALWIWAPTSSCTAAPSTSAATATPSRACWWAARSSSPAPASRPCATSAAASPLNAWLLIRGLKTLPVRMVQHCKNAQIVAEWLVNHPKVTEVTYPGLESHPQHELAKKQMDGFGGLISFHVESRDAGKVVMDNVELCTLAVSLGDVDTLIEHPGTMTHSTYSEEQLLAVGIDPAMIRLSVGLEDPEDIMADLDQALNRIS